MKSLQNEFKKKISSLNTGKEVELQNIFNDLLNKCMLFFTQRSAHLIVGEDDQIVDADTFFLEWFEITREVIVGEKFVDIFDSSYYDLLQDFIKQISRKNYIKHNGIYLHIGDKKYFLDMEGEGFTIEGKKYKIISFRDRDFDVINYKLALIEKKIADIVLRIKDFKTLMKEVTKAFKTTSLFDYIWIGKVDIKSKQVVPIAENGDSFEENNELEWEKIIEVLLEKQDMFFYNPKDNNPRIVFPLFIKTKMPYDSVHYIVLTYAKENIAFKESEIFRLRDIMNKINIAVSEIFLKDFIKADILKDPLTELPLRKVFLDKLEELIEDKIPFTLAILDIDNLSKVNDVLGFWAGDEVLKKISDHLRNIDIDYLSRIGGDEFGIIIKGDRKRVYEVLDKVLEFNNTYVTIDKAEIFTPVSVAVSFFPDDARSVDTLILSAEKTLETGKKKGGKRVEFANENLFYFPKDYLEMEKELIEALKNNEYILYYQPIISLKDKKICGVEALIRWNSPKRGLVPPGKFIPILENSNLINEVGDWVIEEVCRSVKIFEEYNFFVSFSMNISIKQMLSQNIAKKIISQVHKSNIDTDRLIVEITETLLMENIAELQNQINEIVNNGIKIEIDDFGTGYSSLSYLKDLPAYAIKIDKSFIDVIETKENYSLVNAIISMAKALGKETVAEGVEKEEQFKLLQDLGVDMIQGYYFAKPMPEDELINFIENFKFDKCIY